MEESNSTTSCRHGPGCTCEGPHVRRRRAHTKSRSGCSNCKRRRVKLKCDEAVPICGGCSKLAIRCDFNLRGSSAPHLVPEFGTKRGRPPKDWDAIYPSPTDSANDIQSRSFASPTTTISSLELELNASSATSLNVDDLELLHHYLADMPAVVDHDPLWCDQVPRLALNHDFLLSLLLAASAQHLATVHPQKPNRYEILAELHSVAGLQRVRDLLPNLTRDNCGALYIASLIICSLELAKKPTRGNLLLVSNNEEAPWLSLLRGVRYVIETMGFEAIFSGSLSPPQSNEKRQAESGRPQQVYPTRAVDWEPAMSQLSELNSISGGSDADIYRSLLSNLSWCFHATYGTADNLKAVGPATVPIIITWMYRMEDNFIVLLKEQRPMALIIMAHFAVLFHELSFVIYNHQEWGPHLIGTIAEMLDSQHTKWLSWPTREIEIIGRSRFGEGKLVV